MRNILDQNLVPVPIDRGIGEDLLVAIEDESTTTEEALKVDEWHIAMKEEIASIEENRTSSLVNLSKGHRAIGLKWVLKLKQDGSGNIVRHQARLIMKGYVQQQGIDFDEVFALVSRMESIQLVLVVAAHHG
jgi:hypothetical protein